MLRHPRGMQVSAPVPASLLLAVLLLLGFDTPLMCVRFDFKGQADGCAARAAVSQIGHAPATDPALFCTLLRCHSGGVSDPLGLQSATAPALAVLDKIYATQVRACSAPPQPPCPRLEPLPDNCVESGQLLGSVRSGCQHASLPDMPLPVAPPPQAVLDQLWRQYGDDVEGWPDEVVSSLARRNKALTLQACGGCAGTHVSQLLLEPQHRWWAEIHKHSSCGSTSLVRSARSILSLTRLLKPLRCPPCPLLQAERYVCGVPKERCAVLGHRALRVLATAKEEEGLGLAGTLGFLSQQRSDDVQQVGAGWQAHFFVWSCC